MTHSMTGFAAKDSQLAEGNLILELKSVNSRYLDLHFKLDDVVKSVEFQLRDQIKNKLKRGKVECVIQFVPSQQQAKPPVLNQTAITQLKTLAADVKEAFPDCQPLSTNEVLQWPNVIIKNELDIESLQHAALNLLDAGLDALNASRAAEGEKLNQIIIARLDEMETTVSAVRPKMAAAVKQHQEKLTLKLQEAMQTLNDDRIAQELAIYAQRIDVDEELSRLEAHIAEVRKILLQTGAIGKRLDFMMQEMNREANTLGSKSLSIDTTNAAMSLKVLIEQMREQVQNIA